MIKVLSTQKLDFVTTEVTYIENQVEKKIVVDDEKWFAFWFKNEEDGVKRWTAREAFAEYIKYLQEDK